MTNLKTLKDFESYTEKEELRQEAIKYIKELKFRESYQEHNHTKLEHELYDHALIHSIDFIKHFFNITEEDLK